MGSHWLCYFLKKFNTLQEERGGGVKEENIGATQSLIFRWKSYGTADHHNNILLLYKLHISLDTEGEISLLFRVRISLECQGQTTGSNSLLRTFAHMPEAWKFYLEQLRLKQAHHVFIHGLPCSFYENIAMMLLI